MSMPNVYKVWVESSRPKEELEKLVMDAGFKLDEREPEIVITYGGEYFSARSTAPISTS